MDDARMADFMGRLDEVNALAERSPGYVWRLQGENGNATDLKFDDDPLFIVNLTVWESLDDLHNFTYRSEHKTVFARRFEWFERSIGPNVVLWWQPAGTIPTVEDALRRLALLAANGPTPEAFTFKERFEPPGPA
jgi:heme-degrading monooxygenase HmoA